MDASFWHKKWEKGDIGFHAGEVNPLLIKHFDKLNLVKGSRIFLPLCGKTRDIAWLLSKGYQVVGAELSELAVNALFCELGIKPVISKGLGLDLYQAKNIDIYVGDIFNLSAETLRAVDAIYDRAALVALPEKMRNRYAAHLRKITDKAPQLLICYDYDQRLMDGPPFSIKLDEIKRHYTEDYALTLIESDSLQGGLKRKIAAIEMVWLLQKTDE